MTDKLLPCPFCGGEATRSAKNMHGLYQVFCLNEECHASTGWSRDADARWNRRAETKPIEIEGVKTEAITIGQAANAISIICNGNGCPPDVDCYNDQNCHECYKRFVRDAFKPDIAIPITENAPLTLDELRGIKGEPVYLAYPNAPELDGWQIVKGVDDEPDEDGSMGALFTDDIWEHIDFLGEDWLAYRRKPEGV